MEKEFGVKSEGIIRIPIFVFRGKLVGEVIEETSGLVVEEKIKNNYIY